MAYKEIYIDKLVRIVLVIGIIAWSAQLIYPLLGILAWAFILAVIVYPAYRWLSTRIGNHSILAATMITLCLLLLVVGITFFITNDVAHSLKDFTARISTNEQVLPKPPEFIKDWPLIGDQVNEAWTSASENLKSEIAKYSDTLVQAGKYALSKLLTTSKDFLLFVIAIILSGILLVHSDNFMIFIRHFAKRVAHERGIDILKIIKETIQNVSRGIIGIALLQTLIFWLVLFIADVPGVGVLSLLALIISIAQVGLILLVIPLIVWLFFTKTFALALTISVFLIFDALLDSFLKPILLARGLSTPTIIIFIGVIGGILVYGLIGVFIGPVVLAIAYNLLNRWMSEA